MEQIYSNSYSNKTIFHSKGIRSRKSSTHINTVEIIEKFKMSQSITPKKGECSKFKLTNSVKSEETGEYTNCEEIFSELFFDEKMRNLETLEELE